MKTKTVPHLILTLACLIFLVSTIQTVNSQNMTQNHESSSFSGSDFKMENVVTSADAIFIGEIIQIGGPTLSGAGGAEFSGNQVKVLQVLLGSVVAQQVTVSFKIAERAHEQTPDIGSSYIFFVKKVTNPDPDPYTAIKLLPATDSNTTRVKAFIAATPAGK